MTNGRQKGSTAEREVAAIVQDWWRQLEPECSFVRVPLSGGWGNPTLRADFKTSGDLMTNAKGWPWTIEVKRRESWSPKEFFSGRRSPIWGWWEQAVTQSIEQKLYPLLVFRKSREPWRAMLSLHNAVAIREHVEGITVVSAAHTVVVYPLRAILDVHPSKVALPLF